MSQTAGHLKVMVIGDGTIGKTSLLVTYSTGSFPIEESISTVVENYNTTCNFNDRVIQLNLWDIVRQEGYDTLRTMKYPQTDIFVLCFSISEQQSLANAKGKWMAKIREHYPETPVILVGTKLDMREETPEKCINYETGRMVAEEIGAKCYVECCAKTNLGVKDVFVEVIKAASCPGAS